MVDGPLVIYWFMLPLGICVATCALLAGIGGAAIFAPIFLLIFPLLGKEYPLKSPAASVSIAIVIESFGFTSGEPLLAVVCCVSWYLCDHRDYFHAAIPYELSQD
jgi:hypothetical protein